MKKIKITIIGSSIAGSSLAYLLARSNVNVRVYEQEKEKDVGKKLCANIITKTFIKFARKLGINPNKVIENKFKKAVLKFQNKEVIIPIKEYKLNREKFVNLLIKKAKQEGAKFFFKTKFISLKKKNKGYEITLKKSRKITEKTDIIVGADGATSEVAKKANLWQNRKLGLAIQIKSKKHKLKIKKQEYYIFLDKKYGYYSYIVPSKKYTVIGGGDYVENNPNKNFKNFLSFLKIKRGKKQAALVPAPKPIKPRKDNIFLIGDAACHARFSAGGIIPAIKASFALRDIITKNNYTSMKKLEKQVFLNSILSNVIKNFNDKDFSRLLEITSKNKKIKNLVTLRDEFSTKKFVDILLKNPKLIFSFIPMLNLKSLKYY